MLVGVTAQEQMKKLANDRKARSKGGTVPHANDFSSASPAESFAAQAYYHMPPAPAPQPTTPGFSQLVDFHQALTFVGQHGVLQRALGLVFDLLVPVKGLGLTSTLNTNVFVTASLQVPGALLLSPGYASVTPRTHCDASTTVFEPHAVSSDLTGRQLTVGDPTSFLAHVIDFDGAGLRASNFATQIHLTEAPAAINARYAAAAVAPEPTTPMSPPMIRSNGLTLTQVNRGVTFASSLARAFLLFDAVVDSNPVPDLTAEDLVRGYVLDVLDVANNAWRSTARVGADIHDQEPVDLDLGPDVPAVLRVLYAGPAAGPEHADRSERSAGQPLGGNPPLQRLEQRGAAARRSASARRLRRTGARAEWAVQPA